ncbi:tellurite resistance/C4-dicarboxylate transporter family protein [Gordonia hydrophobica]|uniref:Tellurite resistance/C4-dicarboxylate transporter family protein n=1 Tax=Gordonia hydrophobica TaxID=40516 RepID=A0ABZ2UA36_9ACTN|nr:tellurite resistance/C4-dicarboxylate transporter family protein [Gordonia hydrophobica]
MRSGAIPEAAGRAVRELNPAYFGMVMATGIVSIAAKAQHWDVLSTVLFAIAGVAYAVLVLMNLARLLRFRQVVALDLRVPTRTFGFFTIVAATGVLGSRVMLDGQLAAAVVFLAVTAGLWLVLGYLLPPLAFSTGASESQLERADGTWFLWVVATQSVAVLAAAVQPHVDTGRAQLALLAVLCWSVGVFLYVAVALFVASRVFIHQLRPGELSGAYWIAMGATAITVVAGANIAGMADAPILRVTQSTIEAGSVIFWAFGTWLVPPLLFAGYWRHIRHRVPLSYDISFWSIVFPLGMYGVGSRQLGTVNDIPLLDTIGHVEIWVAVVAWALTFAGFLLTLVRWAQSAIARTAERAGPG